MASIASQSLNLPEILSITFVFLDNKSLVACAQVNNLWADEATNFLWQEPSMPALARLVPSGRAQIYANKITRLGPHYWESFDYESHQACQHLLFPRLIETRWFVNDVINIQLLLQYLQPPLKTFEMVSSWQNDIQDSPRHNQAIDTLFMQLSTRCSNLYSIRLSLSGLSCSGLLKFLEDTPSLRSIELWPDLLVTDKVLHHIAARPNLTTLRIERTISGEVAAHVEADTASPFADLETLEGLVDEDSVVVFSRHMQKLETLIIELDGSSTNLLPVISRFSALRVLVVSFSTAKSTIEALDLISLARGCQRLTEISFISNRIYGGDFDGFSITDADICHFSSLLPDLESLSLHCSGKLSVQSVHHLGRNCPKLRECRLGGCILDVSKFLQYHASDTTTTSDADSSVFDQHRDTTPRLHSTIIQNFLDPLLMKSKRTGEPRLLFPKLELLEVDEYINSRNANVTITVSHFLSEAPQLRVVFACSGSQQVADAFSRLISERLNAKQARTNT
ncbi:MAG: hypothetical protein ASARMPREDX12_004374 [Alectoria sarmentosa]|nr:MAG: hypothetical protein ASARMPREDX12_004374 [Alectoria sarmentosa]